VRQFAHASSFEALVGNPHAAFGISQEDDGGSVAAMTKPTTIDEYHAQLDDEDRAICDLLRAEIVRALPEAESKLWHAHPVWFLDGNPIVGYDRLKHALRLMFWSGQSFDSPGLSAEGTFKAAEVRYTAADQVDVAALAAWLAESRTIQWNYRDIRRSHGQLERLA
jgi:hypothetical protein